MEFERLHKINKELLEKSMNNLEKSYDEESFHVFSKCLRNHYYICWAKEYEEEKEGYEHVWRGREGEGYYKEERKVKEHPSRMNNFKRETEMIKEVERLLEDEDNKEKTLEQLEETFKDLKIMYPNFYETALRKVRKI